MSMLELSMAATACALFIAACAAGALLQRREHRRAYDRPRRWFDLR